MLKLFSALAIAAVMAVAGSSAYAAPAVSLLDSLKSNDHGVVQKVYWRHRHCWWRHGYRHCHW